MGERKSYEYLNKLKNKFGVDVLYSWSRYHRAIEDPYGYMLNYIKHEKEIKKDSIYGVSGGICHDIIEKYYLGELKYEEMLSEYECKLDEMNLMELKYDRMDKEKNKKIAEKYEGSIRLFFKQYKPLETKMKLEQFVTIKVGRFYFQGYIDFLHRDSEGNYIIEDFKTSTIYTGKKLINESGQLILYAMSLIQRGINLNNIKVRYNFLKYCTVESDLFSKDKETKLYKTKEKNCVRYTWVKDSEANIRKWITKLHSEYDELEIENMIQGCIEDNNLESLPQDIQDKFRIKDCYVFLDLTQDMIDDLSDDIITTLEEVETKTKSTKILLKQIEDYKSKDKDDRRIISLEDEIDKMWWTEIDGNKEYFFYNLCGYTRQQHKPWDEYLKEISLFKKEDNFDSEYNEEKEDDDSWLDLL